jgi:hypothetical protein
VKRTGRDEPIGVVIHICVEITQGNSLYSYLYLKLAKTPCSSFFFVWFFFYKIRDQEGGTGCVGQGEERRVGGGGLALVGGRRW